LQNESIDDEFEHFEDVIEETDKKPVTVSKKPSDDIVPVQNGDTANSDADSSENEDDQLASSEDDDDDLDDALEDGSFSLEKSKTKHKKSKSESDDEDKKTQESAKKHVLPGGYDPRHREPSYW
jgi:ribosome biogenesis protein MAK21